MTHPTLYLRLRKETPRFVRRVIFDLYERDRWEAALSRAWFRCQERDGAWLRWALARLKPFTLDGRKTMPYKGNSTGEPS